MTPLDFYGTDADIARLESRWQTQDTDRALVAATLAWYLRERDPERAAGWCAGGERALDESEHEDCSVRARLVLVRACRFMQLNELPVAQAHASDAARGFETATDLCGQGDALLLSAELTDMQGDLASALRLAESAVELYKLGGETVRERAGSLVMARLAAFHQLDEAERLIASSAASIKPGDPPILELLYLRGLAFVASAQGEPTVAVDHLRRVHHLAVAIGAMSTAAHTACNIAACCVNLGDFASAMEWSALALDIARPRGFVRPQASAFIYRADSLCELGRPQEAMPVALEARALLDAPATRSSRNYALACGVHGRVSLALGDAEHALACFLEAETIADRLGCADLLSYSLMCKSHALRHLGHTAQALAALDQTLAVGNGQFRADALHAMAAIYRDQGRPAPAGSSSPTGAIHCLHAALDQAARIPRHPKSPDWLAELSRDYEACGDLASALALERQSNQAREALHGRRTGNLAATLLVRHESERSASESAHLRALSAEQAQRAEAERLRADAELHTDRVKSNFLANMTHELRSPLNAMLGFTRIMLRDPGLAHRHEELRIVMRSGERLYDLMNQVMELAKIEAGRAALVESDFDLAALLEDLRGIYGAHASDKGVSFTIGLDEEVPGWVHADAVKLRQVLASLLGNAVKFTDQGFIHLKVMSGPTGALLDFVIEDSGSGMHADDVERTGQVFMQGIGPQRAAIGPGLGLAVSRALVRLMGGELQIHGEPGRGTRVSVTVPVKPVRADIAVPVPQRRIKRLAPSVAPPRVLIVDDRAEARLLLARTLAPIGFELREAADGEQAVTAWREWAPQLILMDMRMPVMDGREATARIKSGQGGAATVVIAVTASSYDEQREQIIEAGCDDFIRKPFSEQALLQTIATHLRLTYVHDDDVPAAPLAGRNPHAVGGLPAQLKAQLSDALARLDVRAVDSAIDAVRALDPAAADSLLPLARRFDYERIKSLLE